MTFLICLVKLVFTPGNNGNGELLNSGEKKHVFHDEGTTEELKHYSSKHSVDAKFLSVDQM